MAKTNSQEILTIIALCALGLCVLVGLFKLAVKSDKQKQQCDKACSALVFIAIALLAISPLLHDECYVHMMIPPGQAPCEFAHHKKVGYLGGPCILGKGGRPPHCIDGTCVKGKCLLGPGGLPPKKGKGHLGEACLPPKSGDLMPYCVEGTCVKGKCVLGPGGLPPKKGKGHLGQPCILGKGGRPPHCLQGQCLGGKCLLHASPLT